MKVLLIGGTGVLSSEMMNLSVSLGHDVYVINRGTRRKKIPHEVHFLQADINNRKQVESLVNGIFFDVIVDFLCYKKSEIENRFPVFANSCKQYIFISSAAVYDPRNNLESYTEESPLINPLWKYSVNKVECENAVASLCKQCGIHYTIIRPGVTYDNTRIPYGIMPAYGYHWTLVGRILNDKPVLLWDEGKHITTITRVEDFAKGVVGLFTNKMAYNQAFNVTGDESYSWIEVVNALGEVLKKKPIVASVPKEFLAEEMPSQKGQILGGRGYDLVCNNSKIKSVVHGFGTTIPLKVGLEETVLHYKNNNYLSGIDYMFDGTIDHILHRYYVVNNRIKLGEFNLRHVDYLKTGCVKDRLCYLTARYSGPMLVRMLSKMRSIGERACNATKKIAPDITRAPRAQ